MKKFFITLLLFHIFLLPSYAIEKPSINASAAIAIDTVSGRILYEKNAFTKKPMASTTKVMTAIIAIENNDLNDIVKISKKAASTGGSSVHLKEGQEIKLEELLYGLMLASGNDAAVAIAEHTSGNIQDFAKLMNAKATELGAFNTNFITPHGLDNEGHYSTAYDMAIITRYALKNPIIAKLVSTQSKYMTFTDGSGRNLNNTNALLSSYSGANGVKTGYTALAGKCLIGSATRNNWQIISVVFGEPNSSSRINDSVKILNYCFENYKFVDLREFYKINFSISIEKGIKKDFIPQYENSLLVPVTDEEKNAIKIKKELSENLIAPLASNCIVGKIEFMLNDESLGHINLINPQKISHMNIFDYYKDIVKNFLNISTFN